eukprot:gnl/TRDRNA2_/TRDRNA2_156520_c0_seq1.p1 gnl/TRDRNA2_/TRDRNA2_156520_c0~~gnl/TRDRNA2_/TRDRNA2_156520_c0_seq1.p1  ORF type:complete len:303 (-),score=72.79 gnl/TRDRNA2_/TRDRNA2_156520_c0_seq1:219-1085(-)
MASGLAEPRGISASTSPTKASRAAARVSELLDVHLIPAPLSGHQAASKDSPPSSGGMMMSTPRKRLGACEMEQLVVSLDQRVDHCTQSEESGLRILADQTERLLEALQAMKVAREISDERKLKEIRMIENNMLLDLNVVRQARQETEHRAVELAEARMRELREEVLREKLTSPAGIPREDYAGEIGEEVRRLDDLVEEQRRARIDYGARIASSLEGEFSKMQEAMAAEQNQRFEAEGTMLRMLEDVCSKLEAEIVEEKSKRKCSQEKLLSMLEDLCSQLERTHAAALR